MPLADVLDDMLIRPAARDRAARLPSASVRYDLTGADQVYASVARTVRRASFEYLSPVTLEEELGDNDFRGDPTLEPEKAWGLDVGYERRMGRDGTVGWDTAAALVFLGFAAALLADTGEALTALAELRAR